MRLGGFLCIGGYEVANQNRSMAYGDCGIFTDCPCPALDDDYVSPAADPAPWYLASRAESADFLGFLPQTIELSVPASRPVSDVLGEGSVVGPESLPGRVVEVTGWMLARDSASMYWGERWLTEALRGSMCKGGCEGDVLDLLAYCRDDCPDMTCEMDFRRMVGTALVDGPRFSELAGDAELLVGQAQFQFTSSMPWLYRPADVAVDAVVVAGGDTDCVLVTTDEWFDGEALVIDLQASDLSAATDLTVTITFTLDGTCPETRVPASVTYSVPNLVRSSGLTIDGTRRQVRYHNPTDKRDEPGFRYVDFEGRFCWPILPACSSLCVCLDNGGAGDVSWAVTRYGREL